MLRSLVSSLRPGKKRSAFVRATRVFHAEILEARTLLAADPVISEFMADNANTIDDGYGTSSDWIEINNQGDMPIDLGGWYLTDDPSNLTKWQFPDSPESEINAGEFRVVYASNTNPMRLDPAGNLHAGFRLGAGGEFVALVDADGVTVVSEYGPMGTEYPEQFEDVAYGMGNSIDTTTLVAAGAPVDAIVATASTDSTYGTSWRGGDEATFLAAGGLTGWISGNGTGVGYDTNTDYVGLIDTDVSEAMFNQGTSAYLRIPFTVADADAVVGLTLRMLYDDGFVAYLNGQEVARQFFDGDPAWNSVATTPNHEAAAFEDFDITGSQSAVLTGQNILAIHGMNRTIDSSDFLVLPELVAQVTIGTLGIGYLPVPTPGGPNGPSVDGFVADTGFSVDRGIYFESFEVVISTDTPGSTIVYTTDGSTPSESNGIQVPSSSAQTPPAANVLIGTTTTLRAIAIKPGLEPTNVDTQTYIFPAAVANQTGVPTGYPTVWNNVTADYEVDPDVTGNPLYASTFAGDLQSIPIVSLVSDSDNFFDAGTGIYVNPEQRGVVWERPVSVELLNFDNQSDMQVDAGVRIFGGVSRQLDRTPKKSFRLQFKSEYGAAKLNFPFFADSPVDSFDRLMLRGGYNYKWTHSSAVQETRAQYMRDQFSRASQLAMGQPASHGRYVHVFINGLYWGMYNAVERPDESFAESYFGGDKDDYDVIKHGTPPEPINGDRVAWDAMFAIAKDEARSPADKYNDIQEYLDIDNLIDYMIMIHYTGNVDAPILIGSTTSPRNFYASRPRVDGGQYKFFLWDSEHTLSETNVDRTELGVGNADDTPARLYGELRESEEFRLRFADHINEHFFNGGALAAQSSINRYVDIASQIDRAIVGESARWGDVRRAIPYTRDAEWLAEQNRLVQQFFPARHAVILNQWRADDLYPSAASPVFSQHGGSFVDNLDVTMSASAGTVFYTVDGTDPRDAINDEPSAAALSWDGTPISITSSTTLSARVLLAGEWSALTSAVFVEEIPPALRVTEIMYHPETPAVGDAIDLEFVELQNVGTQPLAVSGFQFTAGIDFTFPAITLAVGERVVVVSNQVEYLAHYGNGATIAGEFTGQLNNGGERIELVGSVGELIHDFAYQDKWYPHTDGEGYSLVVIDATAPLPSWNNKSNWRASETNDGSPGGMDLGFDPETIVINEVSANGTEADGNWVELYNSTNAQVDLSDWWLSNATETLAKVALPAGSIVPANGYLVLSQLTDFGTSSDPMSGFDLSPAGGDLLLSSPGDGLRVGGYRESINYDGSPTDGSYGTHVNSEGDNDFTLLSNPTRGSTNSSPAAGPVVINEVMYQPTESRSEFIEIVNRTSETIELFDALRPTNTWGFTNGVTLTFPAGTTLAAGELLVVASTDDATFRSQYSVPAQVTVLGPYDGSLDNAGERLTLSMPGTPLPDGTVSQIPVDQLRYNDTPPWPVAAAGNGGSLNRIDLAAYGNEPLVWGPGTSGGTPGEPNVFIDGTPPLVPRELTAQRVTDTAVRLSWQPSVDVESGISAYRVFLDGTFIGSSIGTEFDYELDFANASYAFQVSAVNSDGLESERSADLATTRELLRDGQAPDTNYLGTTDTFIGAGGTDAIYGQLDVLVADFNDLQTQQQRRMLLRWDVSSLGTANGLLDAAVQIDVLSGTTDREFLIYALNRDWRDGEATWNQFSDGNSWQVAGADGPLDRGDEILGTATPADDGILSFEFNASGIQLVETWIADASVNHGLLLVDAASVAPAQAPPPVAPVIHWQFDDTLANSGTGGSPYDAQVIGGAPVYVTGQASNALDLQNQSNPPVSTGGQYVSVDYQLPDQGTIVLWYYADAFYNFQTIFDNSANSNDWETWIYADGRLRSRIDSNSGQVTYDLNTAGGADQWFHVAYSWDRSDGTASAAKMYVDGNLVGTDDILPWVMPGTTFYLGGGNDENTYGSGNFDDVRIYDYVLSADHVTTLFGGETEEPQLQSGLVSYWTLDDGITDPDAGIALDSTGTNDGQLGGFDPPTWLDGTQGKVGGALKFDGADDHIFIPNSPSLDLPTNAVTLATWVNMEFLPSQISESFAAIFDSTQDAYILYEDRGNNELRFKVTDSDGTAERPGIPSSMLSSGVWHHVVGVYDGDAGQAMIYLDGQLVDTHANASLTNTVRTGQVAAIGRQGSSATSHFAGQIDEVALWDRALTLTEVDALWNNGNGVSILGTDVEPEIYLPLDGDVTNHGMVGAKSNGTLIDGANGQATFVTTELGQGLDLDNVGSTNGDYVSIPYVLSDQGAMALWYYVDDYATNQTILDNSASADHWKLVVDTTGQLRFQAGPGAGQVAADLNPLGGPNQWYHFALNWDRGDASVVQLVINGNVADASPLPATQDPGNEVFLGGGHDGNAYGSGVWDDVRIYNQTLQLGAIQNLATARPLAKPLVVVSSENESVEQRPLLRVTYTQALAGDFDNDHQLGCSDIDALVQVAVGDEYDSEFDLDQDGSVDLGDVERWVLTHKRTSMGDANLDFVVDAIDFGIWFDYRFTQVSGWCSGDLNADGVTDVSDFNIWNDHKFTTAAASAAPAARIPFAPLHHPIDARELPIGELLPEAGDVVEMGPIPREQDSTEIVQWSSFNDKNRTRRIVLKHAVDMVHEIGSVQFRVRQRENPRWVFHKPRQSADDGQLKDRWEALVDQLLSGDHSYGISDHSYETD